jgi:long-chain acyl-CoA synthetase
MLSESLYDVRHIENLRDLLEQSEKLFGENNAFLVKDSSSVYRGISYKRFKRDVDAFGAALKMLGLRGSLIAVLGENRYEWCVSYLSIANYLGVVVPLDKELPVSEKENLLLRSEVAAIVFSGKYLEEMRQISKNVAGIKYFINMDAKEDDGVFLSYCKLMEAGGKLLSDGDTSLYDYAIDKDKMSILLFTSGTTDLAKGVMLSHRNICTNIMSVCRTVATKSSDVSLSILPLHHTFECTLGFLAMIYSGAAIAFNEGLKHISKNFREARPTYLMAVPLLVENMYKKIWDQAGKKTGKKTLLKGALIVSGILYDVFEIDIRRILFKSIHMNLGGRLRLLIIGGAAVDPDVSKAFRKFGIRVLQGYGLTECSPLVTGNRDSAFRDNSVGLPLPDVQVKIDNADKKGIGEIITKGDNVMLGYYKNEEATAKCLKDGWFHTGDLGKVDGNGFFYITGRLKNVIIAKNGENIFPEEVEAYINKSPYVLESMVTGNLDKGSGETKVSAHIFPDIEAIKEKFKLVSVSKEDILSIINDVIRSVNSNMPLYKRVRAYTIRDTEFAKTTTQKIKRYTEKNN